MHISSIMEENKRIIMDLDVVLKSGSCNNIVKCFGYIITEYEVWICMELMKMCFEKLLKINKGPIPETILGKLTLSVFLRALFIFVKFFRSSLKAGTGIRKKKLFPAGNKKSGNLQKS